MKRPAALAVAALLLSIPLLAAEPERGGPPPPGYERIVGEPVPDWKPSDMLESGATTWTPLGPRPIKSEYWSGSDDASGRVVSIASMACLPLLASALIVSSGQTWANSDLK